MLRTVCVAALALAGCDEKKAAAPSAELGSAKAAAPAPADAASIVATDAEDVPVDIPVVDVTLAKLVADYQENEVAADDKYKDQVLNLHSVVHRISKEHGIPVLELQVGETHVFVRAFFASEKGLAALKPGQATIAHCFCRGFPGRRLVLNSCELQ